MIWAIVGILIGIIVGINTGYSIPIEYIKYSAIIIVGILDSLFGAVKAEVSNETYSSIILLTGLLFNIILAILITYLGEKLGLELYLAAAVVFTFRIFSNLAIIRRSLIENYIDKKKTLF